MKGAEPQDMFISFSLEELQDALHLLRREREYAERTLNTQMVEDALVANGVIQNEILRSVGLQ